MDNSRPDALSEAMPTDVSDSKELRGSQHAPSSHAGLESDIASARIDLRDSYSELPSVPRSHSERHIWVPIGVALGAFLLGGQCSRLGVVHRPRNFLTFRMKLAGASAGLGTVLFWEMGASEHIRRLESNPDLARPWVIALDQGKQNRAKFQHWKKTTYPHPKEIALYERVHGPYVAADASVWDRCIQMFQYYTHHMWSSHAAQTYSRGPFAEILRALDVTPHDIDIWVTSFSRKLEPNSSKSKEEYAGAFTAVALAARVLSNSPAPFLNTCLVLGVSALALSRSFYRYQFYSYPSLLQDREALQFALVNWELGAERAMKSRTERAIEQANANIEDATKRIEELEAEIRGLQDQLDRNLESEQTPSEPSLST